MFDNKKGGWTVSASSKAIFPKRFSSTAIVWLGVYSQAGVPTGGLVPVPVSPGPHCLRPQPAQEKARHNLLFSEPEGLSSEKNLSVMRFFLGQGCIAEVGQWGTGEIGTAAGDTVEGFVMLTFTWLPSQFSQRLTASTYTDSSLLSLRAAVEKLNFSPSPIASLFSGAMGVSESLPVASPAVQESEVQPVNNGVLSLFGVACRVLTNIKKWSERQDYSRWPSPGKW